MANIQNLAWYKVPTVWLAGGMKTYGVYHSPYRKPILMKLRQSFTSKSHPNNLGLKSKHLNSFLSSEN